VAVFTAAIALCIINTVKYVNGEHERKWVGWIEDCSVLITGPAKWIVLFFVYARGE